MSWADKFNLLNGLVILRLICGLFFIPHLYAKFFVPEALGFFVAAGFKPPAVWMYIACAVDAAQVMRFCAIAISGVLTIGLIFDIYTHSVAWLAFIHLCIAGAAVYKVTGKWLWNIGGFEYCLFWAIACAVVGMMTPA